MNTRGPYTLYPYQELGVKFITSRKYALLADDMGLGKTIQALEAALQLGAKRVIIVCPGFLCNQWKKEASKFYSPYGIETSILPSKAVNLPVEFTPNFIIIVSYDMAWRRMSLLQKTEYDFAIIDESHYMKNSKAKRTNIILGKGSFLTKTKRALLMTGTPMLNKPIDLYTILRNFVPEVLKSYIAWPLFVTRFCGFQMKGSKNEEQLSGMLKTFMLRRVLEDVIEELPEIVITKVAFSNVVIPVEYQFENVVIQRREVAIAKLPQTIEYLENLLQSSSKIVVICYHKNTIETLTETFKKYKAVAIHGAVTGKQRTDRLDSFISGEAEVLFAQISTIGIGVDGLQRVANRIVFAESDWSPAIIQQAIARLKRIGQESGTVFVDFLISEGTVEEDIDYALIFKEKMINKIVGGTWLPQGLEEIKQMPYGYGQQEFKKLSPKAQQALEAHGGDPNHHLPSKQRYYEKVHEEREVERIKQMAKPGKVDSPNGKSEVVKKAEELLGKAVTTLVSALVHELMNGGAPDSFVSEAPPLNLQIAGNVVPPEERTIPTIQLPELPAPVLKGPSIEETTAMVTGFMDKLKQHGLNDQQALAHYKGMSSFPGKKMAETNDAERTELARFFSTVSEAYLQNVAAQHTPPASTSDI